MMSIFYFVEEKETYFKFSHQIQKDVNPLLKAYELMPFWLQAGDVSQQVKVI